MCVVMLAPSVAVWENSTVILLSSIRLIQFLRFCLLLSHHGLPVTRFTPINHIKHVLLISHENEMTRKKAFKIISTVAMPSSHNR